MNKELFKALRKKEQFYTTYPLLLASKYFKGNIKIVLTLMLNDVEMNGRVQWCHQTYADKSGTTRPAVIEYFKQLQELKVIKPLDTNKNGSRHNKFDLNWQVFLQLCKSQPVKKSQQPVKKTTLTCKENSKTSKESLQIQTETDILQKSNISREKTSFKDVSPKQMEALMQEIKNTI